MVGLVASLALGLVFLVAGGSKIAAGPSWPRQAVDLGVPRPFALALPWWELVVGATLAAQVAPLVGGIAALVTLVVFTVALVARLAQGQRPACACFGAWSASPIGWRHVARNAGFAALAIVVISSH